MVEKWMLNQVNHKMRKKIRKLIKRDITNPGVLLNETFIHCGKSFEILIQAFGLTMDLVKLSASEIIVEELNRKESKKRWWQLWADETENVNKQS